MTSLASPIDWRDLVGRIRQKDPSAIEDLYRWLNCGLRFLLSRDLAPEDVDDRIHEILVIAVDAIRREELRSPEALASFLRTVTKRQVAAHINTRAWTRTRVAPDAHLHELPAAGRANPEEQLLAEERRRVGRVALERLRPKEREILRRYYVLEQTEEQIREEMGLTSTQYRLLKSRAKARFGECGRREMARGGPEGLAGRSAVA